MIWSLSDLTEAARFLPPCDSVVTFEQLPGQLAAKAAADAGNEPGALGHGILFCAVLRLRLDWRINQ